MTLEICRPHGIVHWFPEPAVQSAVTIGEEEVHVFPILARERNDRLPVEVEEPAVVPPHPSLKLNCSGRLTRLANGASTNLSKCPPRVLTPERISLGPDPEPGHGIIRLDFGP